MSDTEDRGIARQLLLPETVTEDDDRVAVRDLAFIGAECSAQFQVHAEYGEEIRADQIAHLQLGHLVARGGESSAQAVERQQPVEALRAIADRRVFGVRRAQQIRQSSFDRCGRADCEDLERALATNLLGPFRLTKAVLGALSASARDGRGAVVVNVSSDAAINPYPTWGAYGASKAALRHLSAIWGAELDLEGVRVLSLDPGDMDTPLHAQAVPDADPSTLKRPELAALDIIDRIAGALPVVEGVADRSGCDRMTG